MRNRWLAIIAMVSCIALSGCHFFKTNQAEPTQKTMLPAATVQVVHPDDIPAYTGAKAYAVINGNVPFFTEADVQEGRQQSFERYAPLDELKRYGVAYARIGKDVMPTEKRGPIGMVKPSGWQLAKYDIVDGKYLYNRCHLIGFQLAGENANPLNLITGTRYLNVIGMLPFENRIADYVKQTGNHVLYRVTPLFNGHELVARGVLMEAYSIEDNGKLKFNVFCYNVQPGIWIDYNTGKSRLDKMSNENNKAVEKSIQRHNKKEAKKKR